MCGCARWAELLDRRFNGDAVVEHDVKCAGPSALSRCRNAARMAGGVRTGHRPALQKLLQPADTFDYAQLIAALRSALSMPAA